MSYVPKILGKRLELKQRGKTTLCFCKMGFELNIQLITESAITKDWRPMMCDDVMMWWSHVIVNLMFKLWMQRFQERSAGLPPQR